MAERRNTSGSRMKEASGPRRGPSHQPAAERSDTTDGWILAALTSLDTEVIQRAGNALGALMKDVSIDHRSGQIPVPEKLLDRADVGAALKEMSGDGMPQGVSAHIPGQALPSRSSRKRIL